MRKLPGCAAVPLCCAVSCCPAGDYSKALDIYIRALQHCPNSARVLVNASLAMLRLSRHEDAFEKASLAVGLQPDNVKAYHARHKAREALGDYKVCVCRQGRGRWLLVVAWLVGTVGRQKRT